MSLDVLRKEAKAVAEEADAAVDQVKAFAERFHLAAPNFQALTKASNRLDGLANAPQTVRIGVFGQKESGKSTLINAILGQKAVSDGDFSTAVPTQLSYHDREFSLQVVNKSGKDEPKIFPNVEALRNALLPYSRERLSDLPEGMNHDVTWLAVEGPFDGLKNKAGNRRLELIDLPGSLDTDNFVAERLQAGLRGCDALIVAVPGTEATAEDRAVITEFSQFAEGRPLIVCWTKADSRPKFDRLSPEEISSYVKQQSRALLKGLGLPEDRGILLLTAARQYLLAKGLEVADSRDALAKEFGYHEPSKNGIEPLRKLILEQTDPKFSDEYREIALARSIVLARAELLNSVRGLLKQALKGGLCDTRESKDAITSYESQRDLSSVLSDLELAAKKLRVKKHEGDKVFCCFGACESVSGATAGPTGLPSCDDHLKSTKVAWVARSESVTYIKPIPKCGVPDCHFPSAFGSPVCLGHIPAYIKFMKTPVKTPSVKQQAKKKPKKAE